MISAEQKHFRVCGIPRMVVGKQEAQRNLREPSELRQRSFRALDAIHDRADDQRQQRPGNPHADLRDKADQHFRFVARHVRKQSRELRPSGDAPVRRFRDRS